MKKSNWIWRFLYKFHRYAGLFSAAILLMLAITGIALNHTEDLKLDSQMIQSKTILDWYGINTPVKLTSFSTKNHWLTQVNRQLFFDQTLLLKNNAHLLGAVETDEFIVVALTDTLLLLTLEGELIEQMPFNAINNIGLDPLQAIVIRSDNLLNRSEDGLLSWQPHQAGQIIWSKTSPLPATIRQNIQSSFHSSILPLERVLLDLHSGRIFGFFGVILVDISGILLIILVFTGSSIWLKHKFRAIFRKVKR
jgi:hypothetical protein